MSLHKYHAVATEVDGIRFASKAEARRYAELRLLEKAGQIQSLTLQPRYTLFATNGAYPERGPRLLRIGDYVADFTYVEHGSIVVEDVKGMQTALYRWKKRHFEAQYGLTITEIGRSAKKAVKKSKGRG